MQQSMRDVTGKVAFVTGGSSGLGLGIVRTFVEAGMKVAFSYRTAKHRDHAMRLLAGHEDYVHPICVDVADRPGMAAGAEEVIARFGKLHVLVNNAAIGLITGLAMATYDDWDWARSVNIDGVFNGIHAFLPLIQAHGEGGHVVSVSSVGGLVAAKAGVYSATKFAVVGMMEGLRTELRGSNIGVSVYCPGGINSNIRDSDRNRPAYLGDTRPPGQDVLDFPEDLRRRVPDPDKDGPGMDPLEAGAWVLRGVQNNDLFILSHPEFEPAVRDRSEALLGSFRLDGPPAPQARLDEEHDVLRPAMYVEERDRVRSRTLSDRLDLAM